MKIVIPSSELINNYVEVSNKCRETKEPIYIRVNDCDDTVIMDIEEFNKIITELELLKELSYAEEDIRNNKVASFEDTMSDIKTILY